MLYTIHGTIKLSEKTFIFIHITDKVIRDITILLSVRSDVCIYWFPITKSIIFTNCFGPGSNLFATSLSQPKEQPMRDYTITNVDGSEIHLPSLLGLLEEQTM